MSIKTYSIEDQERMIRSTFPQAAWRVNALAGRKQKEITELAIHRGITLGHAEYGDSSFHHPLERIKREQLEELADCFWYSAIFTLKERGIIP